MRSFFGRSLLTGIVVSLSMLPFSDAVTAAPLLESIFPLSCEAGNRVTVTLFGKELDKATSLAFSIPEVTATVDDAGKFVVSVAAGTPVQDCDVWCVVDGRVSNPRRFVISTLSNMPEAGKNDSRDAAQTIAFPGAVDGRLEAAAKFDWFQFEAKEGQTLTLSCRSRSLDGSAQPVVTLLSPGGREIAHSTGRRREPLLHRKLPESGTYRVRVFDRAYKTAADSFYRLELLEGPQIIAAWPDLIQRSSNSHTRPTFYGFGLPDGSESLIRLGGSPSAIRKLESEASLSTDFLIHGWQSATESFDTAIPLQPDSTVPSVAGSPRIHITDQAVQYEDETATESAMDAQPLTVPVLLNGRFKNRNDVDWFSFEAKKGETFLIDVYGDRLDHLMDVDAVIMDAVGKMLVTFPDKPASKNLSPVLSQASPDVSGSWKAPADGTFHLVLRDLYGSTLFGVDRSYVLSVRKAQPTFDVVIAPPDDKTPAGYSIPQNGRSAIRVSLMRAKEVHAVQTLVRTAKENECSMGFIMHLTKDGKLKGSTVVPHTVDACLNIDRIDDVDDGARCISFSKNRFGPCNELETMLTRTGYDFNATVIREDDKEAEKKAPSKRDRKKVQVEALLKIFEDKKWHQIGELTSVTDDDVSRATFLLRELTTLGKIEKYGRGAKAYWRAAE